MKDRLGSIIDILDENEALKTTYRYEAFGEPTATHHSGQVDCMYRFTGRVYDGAMGAYFYRARYYNQSLGRFFSRDPIFSLQSLYAYCNNSPVNFRDPFGLENGDPGAGGGDPGDDPDEPWDPDDPWPDFDPDDRDNWAAGTATIKPMTDEEWEEEIRKSLLEETEEEEGLLDELLDWLFGEDDDDSTDDDSGDNDMGLGTNTISVGYGAGYIP